MINIAIDGPSGAGKSTLARTLATHLGFRYVDTGAIYRTMTLGLLEREISFDEISEDHLKNIKIAIAYNEDGLQQMFLNGHDVTHQIRDNEVSKYTSKVATLPMIRSSLLDIQRDTANSYNVIMDGRDISTVVLPEAQVKIFLTASPEKRAERRVLDLEARGDEADFDTILLEIIGRDHRDTNREIAPLRQAETAFLVDTTDMDFQESFQYLLELIQKEMAKW